MIIKDTIKLSGFIAVAFIALTREGVSSSFLYPSIIYKRNELIVTRQTAPGHSMRTERNMEKEYQKTGPVLSRGT